MNLRKANMKYYRLVVFICHDSAEIWGFRYGLTLVIGTLKIMASTGVFVRVVYVATKLIFTVQYPNLDQSSGRISKEPRQSFAYLHE
jgi:hypothetical protein